jgi:hypothetical protein
MFLRPEHVVCNNDLTATETDLPEVAAPGTRRRVGLDKVDDGERCLAHAGEAVDPRVSQSVSKRPRIEFGLE